MTWWVVTLRECGDDEDSLYIVEAEDDIAAEHAAREEFIEDTGIINAIETGERDEPTIYVNHIVRCGDTRPEHVRAVPV